MGNCSQKGVIDGECPDNIRVFKASGGILELRGPKLAKDVLNGYPGYGIFRQANTSSPLSSYEYLIGGQFYSLLPLQETPMRPSRTALLGFGEAEENGPAVEVLPSQGHGVWKVKLVINPKQLKEILSQQGDTEALIEKMRVAAAASSLVTLERRRSKSSRGLARKLSSSNVFKVFPIDWSAKA